ncbi:MAG: hypothetical protein C7B45_03635 [Sulfobacillus acidophilus]|uniref:Uncharacterized protein n=1 Tax=Sulfobacillus acidophilus TaxID=53633 RepID=A0A2T2WLT6_9FIRM|nr:MAG: hypothetical protein C7B45_03635 [Sulfobacillus acidophilus]
MSLTLAKEKARVLEMRAQGIFRVSIKEQCGHSNGLRTRRHRGPGTEGAAEALERFAPVGAKTAGFGSRGQGESAFLDSTGRVF